MAINKTINKRTNTHGANEKLHRIRFASGQTSVSYLTYVTGPYCHDEINLRIWVYKNIFRGKEGGIKRFWENVRTTLFLA